MFRMRAEFLRAVINRRIAAFAISLAALTGMAVVAPAQAAYPDHPVRILRARRRRRRHRASGRREAQ
jgi:uncharacterized membrane protein YdfJ with MMPL/SSD domain